ncbi:hypothetical protein PFICI_13563 [Pestalotiopsis fici W106-1]|uniref:Uncharacterized protein n=1 Tax=Pestalotiopsis fici (strain W106-1 / CGMCC3.15140) TaxID=1229662 RepID=W3WMT1_PESFW|nr:uncharacterized protein PFICI_13563 [Pestalotiopsis fici W106-1]ETS75079.1 hypothetical protein PFICI_13563 [Pestalotiopsis fici W106-1]
MTSFQPLGALRSLSNDSEKFGKSKHKVVKPILKKLSHSEKNSIDLDRGWDEQEVPYRSDPWGAGDYEAGGRTSKDISFGYSEASVVGVSGGRRSYHHSRSISGNSYVSVATSGSGSALGLGIGSRTGTTFVHPFQQTPRTATPPLSYANSLVSFSADRDCSPTITEDDDSYSVNNQPAASNISLRNQKNSTSNSTAATPTTTTTTTTTGSSSNNDSTSKSKSRSSTNSNGSYQSATHQQSRPSLTNPSTQSQPSLSDSSARPSRPSLHSQRTSSYTDTPKSQTSLRISTGIRSASTTPAQSSRLANVSSRSDLQSYLAEESSSSSTTRAPTLRSVASPTSPIASMSPFSRTSLDGFPRLRAKSDLDTATRADHVREARKKIQAKQMAKEEKYARQEIKQRERADNKRAQEAEKRAAALQKEREAAKRQEEIAALAEAMPQKTKHNRKISNNSSGRPSTSQRRQTFESEKGTRNNYSATETNSTAAFDDETGNARHVSFQSTRRSNTAKRKTHGAWTAFILWLRTRLLRMSN